jgi:hypothetical protein
MIATLEAGPFCRPEVAMSVGLRQLPSQPLLEELDDDQYLAVSAEDPAEAAAAMLDLVESLPPFSSQVQRRSAWLASVRQCVAELGETCPEDIEVRLLLAIARTALAGRQTTAALTAMDHGLARAQELGHRAGVVALRALRLPYLAHKSPVDASQEARQLDAAFATLTADRIGQPTDAERLLEAEVLLARLAWAGATDDAVRVKQELAAIGRLTLPRTSMLTWIAFASHSALAQLYLRSRQRAQAAMALLDAARIADGEEAWLELANLQCLIAALGMLAGDFVAARNHAVAATEALAGNGLAFSQPDPWLGLPLDLAPARDLAGAVKLLAESILASQDVGDTTGFLLAAAAMAAFYLADDRPFEALDALTEAGDVARGLEDPSVAAALRSVAEALLGHLGVLKK